MRAIAYTVLNNFVDIYDIVLKQIDEYEDTDEQIEQIVKNGINEGYAQIKKFFLNLTEVDLTITDGVGTLPSDLKNIEHISIIPNAIMNNKVFFNDTVTTVNLKYSPQITPLSADTDVPGVPQEYFYALYNYGCYAYYNHRKKGTAKYYLQRFNEYLDEIENNNTYVIRDNYGFDLGSDF